MIPSAHLGMAVEQKPDGVRVSLRAGNMSASLRAAHPFEVRARVKAAVAGLGLREPTFRRRHVARWFIETGDAMSKAIETGGATGFGVGWRDAEAFSKTPPSLYVVANGNRLAAEFPFDLASRDRRAVEEIVDGMVDGVGDGDARDLAWLRSATLRLAEVVATEPTL